MIRLLAGGGGWRSQADHGALFQPLEAYGATLFGGGSWGSMGILTEFAFSREGPDADWIWKRMGYAEVFWRMRPGLFGTAHFDWLHPDTRVSVRRNAFSRIGAGMSWFPIQHIELGVQGLLRQAVPDNIEANRDEFRISSHLYF